MNKCLCPCPDYINVPTEHGMTETILLKGFGTVVYYKEATTECERCGIELCEDCATGGRLVGHNIDYSIFYVAPILCPACAEGVK